jgi:LPXTG-motif cell wall-anchored protein
VIGVIVGAQASASAQYTDPPPSDGASKDPQVLSYAGTSERSDARAPQTLGEGYGARGADELAAASGSQSLPITGGDVVGLTVIGVGAVAGGTVLLRVRRRADR